MIDLLFIALLLVVTIVLAIFVGFKLSGLFFRKKIYTPNNAVELLKAGRVEEWNEVRILNPYWKPDLVNINLSTIALADANFRQAKLDQACFIGALLDGSNFYKASLIDASFQNASLIDVSFEEANLENADFTGARLTGASFKEAILNNSKLNENYRSSIYISKDVHKEDFEYTINNIINDPSIMDQISPRQFEEIVAHLLERLGYRVQKTSETKDAGYDFIIVKEDPLKKAERTIVEVKRYTTSKPVGVSVVRSIIGSTIANNADHAMIVTNSSFTDTAKTVLEQYPNVIGIDREKLINLFSSSTNV